MVDYVDRKVIALLERPSSKSFGMVPLVVDCGEFYEVLISTVRIDPFIPVEKFESQYGHQVLRVEAQLSKDISNPVALWLGYEFRANAAKLIVPALPSTKSWRSPLEPHKETGQYSIKSCEEAYTTLDNWIKATAVDALKRNNHAIAQLMHWALPLSPETQAAMYFTASNKQNELEWQLRLNNPEGKITINDIVQMHEETRSRLVG